MKNYFIGFIGIVIFFLICYHFYTPVNFDNIKYVKVAGQNIKVELALTREAQERGLSGRKTLNNDEGMLFIFEHPGSYSFWMKEMNFPIDIIWINENKKVIYLKKDARSELYPEIYKPDVSSEGAKYVLEVVSGFSEKNNLRVGDGVEFTY